MPTKRAAQEFHLIYTRTRLLPSSWKLLCASALELQALAWDQSFGQMPDLSWSWAWVLVRFGNMLGKDFCNSHESMWYQCNIFHKSNPCPHHKIVERHVSLRAPRTKLKNLGLNLWPPKRHNYKNLMVLVTTNERSFNQKLSVQEADISFD